MQKIKTTILLLTLFTGTALLSFGQKQRNDSLEKVVQGITISNIYEVSYTVGFAGSVSKQYLRFNKLLSLATEKQLTDMAAQNKNAVVRLYALQALRQKHVKIPDNLLKQFRHDKTIVIILNGCCGYEMTVGEAANRYVQFAN